MSTQDIQKFDLTGRHKNARKTILYAIMACWLKYKSTNVSDLNNFVVYTDTNNKAKKVSELVTTFDFNDVTNPNVYARAAENAYHYIRSTEPTTLQNIERAAQSAAYAAKDASFATYAADAAKDAKDAYEAGDDTNDTADAADASAASAADIAASDAADDADKVIKYLIAAYLYLYLC